MTALLPPGSAATTNMSGECAGGYLAADQTAKRGERCAANAMDVLGLWYRHASWIAVPMWVKLVASMGPGELDSFEKRAFRQWDRASLGDLVTREGARTRLP